jgi:site-specific DNA-methyltransferase (adenine-specific)
MMELRPIVVDENGIILGGNMRYQALKQNGMVDVPDEWVKRADELTETQKREFVVKDNVSFGEFDFDLLIEEWDVDKLQEWGVDLPDIFEETELEVKEDDYEIPDEIKTDIVLGDLIEIGEHRLLCGSSLEADSWEKVTNKKEIDLLVTDPPYGVDYSSKNEALTASDKGNRNQTPIENDIMTDEQAKQFLHDMLVICPLKKGGGFYVFSPPGITETYFRMAIISSGLLLKQCLVWVKNVMVIGRQDYQWKHDSCLYGWKPDAAHYFTQDRTKTTVIDDRADYKNMSKPELINIIKDLTIFTILIINLVGRTMSL